MSRANNSGVVVLGEDGLPLFVDPTEEDFDIAERFLSDDRLREIESKLLGTMKIEKFRGDLWSLHSFDQVRWLVAMGIAIGRHRLMGTE